MLRSQLQSLFDLMEENEYRPARFFAGRLGVCEKTVRNQVEELGDVLRKNGASIESKARHGYRIHVDNRKKFSAFLKQEENAIPKTSSERNIFLLNFLLTNDDYVKIENLSNLLFISRSSISTSIRTVEKTLNQYGIKILRKPNYGIKAVGDEFDIRRLLCYSNMRNRTTAEYLQKEAEDDSDLLWVGHTIIDLLHKYDIHLTEVALDNFTNYVYVGMKRLIAKKKLSFNISTMPVSGIKERAFTDELTRIFQEKYGTEYTEDEKEYILLYLSGKQLAGYTVRSDENFVISEEINRLTLNILKFIDREFHSDYQSNFDLVMALNQHLVPLEIRLKYGLPLTNPMTKQTKTEYPLGYSMALHAKSVICDHYKKNLSEDEVAYLALIFALQLQKESGIKKAKSNVLIVSNANASALNLLKYQYENKLSSRINKVYITDQIGVQNFDISLVDYIFTTVPIMREVPVPIFEIDIFMDESDTKSIEDALWRAENKGLRNCYTPKRFITNLQGSSKEEILKELCEIVKSQEEVSDNFYDLVMERDKDLHVKYNNKITIPHPYELASKYTFAYVAVLEKSIVWNDEEVQVVLLSSPGSDDIDCRQMFYESAAKLVLSPEIISSLIDEPTFENFVNLIEI